MLPIPGESAISSKQIAVGDHVRMETDLKDSSYKVDFAPWKGCPGKWLEFQPGDCFTVTDIRNGFFKAGGFERLWAPLIAATKVEGDSLPDAADGSESEAMTLDALKPCVVPSHGGNFKVHPTKWSMSLQQFRQFMLACKSTELWSEIKTETKRDGKVGFVNGYDFCNRFVKPWTLGTGCGVALLMNSVPEEATVMLTHSWAEDMGQVLQALEREWNGRDARLWFCICANYQCEDDAGPSIQQQLDLDPFGSVVTSPIVQNMAIIHTTEAEVYDRLWCCYELVTAVKCREEGFVIGICSTRYIEQAKANYGKYLAERNAIDDKETDEERDPEGMGKGMSRDHALQRWLKITIQAQCEKATCSRSEDTEMIHGKIADLTGKELAEGFKFMNGAVHRYRRSMCESFRACPGYLGGLIMFECH